MTVWQRWPWLAEHDMVESDPVWHFICEFKMTEHNPQILRGGGRGTRLVFK